MTGDQQRKDAIADVRRAYRLVWAHQRRMLDMVKAIAAAFPETVHYWWNSNEFEGLPGKKSTDPLERWAWDALPYFDVSWFRLLEIENRHKPMPGRWMLEIRHEADDGWEGHDGKSEPDARQFGSAVEASSTLSINLWKSEAENANTWYDAWDLYGNYWPDTDTDPKAVDETSGLRVVSTSRDMAEFASIEDVVAMAHEARRRGREDLDLDIPDLSVSN